MYIYLILCIYCFGRYIVYIIYEYLQFKRITKCNSFITLTPYTPEQKNNSISWIPKYIQSPRYPNWNIYTESTTRSKKPQKTILLVPPLGQPSPDLFLPIITYFGTSLYMYITWDYRGFYKSSGQHIFSGNIHEHALDGVDILDAYGIVTIDIIVGHSIGATIAAEIAVCNPYRVMNIILLNYTPGQSFTYAFSPILPSCYHLREHIVRNMIHTCITNPNLFYSLCKMFKLPLRMLLILLSVCSYSDEWIGKTVFKDPYYLCFLLDNYTKNICTSKQSIIQYFTMFEQLDQHLVDEQYIRANVYLIGGLWDVFTPISIYRKSIRKIKKVTYICDPYSTHVTLLENMKLCVRIVHNIFQNKKEKKTLISYKKKIDYGKM
jgi:pimeloyl-ACP methyl ester carboxylesterase